MIDALPVLMIRNEERFIARVLRPLVDVFRVVVVGDTGSTDETRAIVSTIKGAELIDYGPQSPSGLTEVRRALGRRVVAHGAAWQLLVDGDELYCATTLRALLATELPAHARTGFTMMLTLDIDDQGDLWEMDNLFSRQALLPANEVWTGTYPFDVPLTFGRQIGYYYFNPPTGYRYHALHLHRLERSSQDAAVHLRGYKQQKFSLLDTTYPRTIPFDIAAWCQQ